MARISPKRLLEKFVHADSFSLTGDYNDGYSEEFPYGIYGIEEAVAECALQEVTKVSLEMLKGQYGAFSDEQKLRLPDFEALVSEIKDECAEYFALVESGGIPDGQSPFLADLIFDQKTKYYEPPGIWHFYHELYAEHMIYGSALNAIKKNLARRNPEVVFDNPYYAALKPCLIRTETTFAWHCTVSGRLSNVYYFAINPVSLAWLGQLKNVYDLQELDDLAFYKNGKVIFSSCTHERFCREIKNPL